MQVAYRSLDLTLLGKGLHAKEDEAESKALQE